MHQHALHIHQRSDLSFMFELSLTYLFLLCSLCFHLLTPYMHSPRSQTDIYLCINQPITEKHARETLLPVIFLALSFICQSSWRAMQSPSYLRCSTDQRRNKYFALHFYLLDKRMRTSKQRHAYNKRKIHRTQTKVLS